MYMRIWMGRFMIVKVMCACISVYDDEMLLYKSE